MSSGPDPRPRDRRSQREAIHLGNLGAAYARLGEYARAIEFFEQDLALTREIGDRQGEAKTSWNLGVLHEKDDPARAVELLQVCVDLERELGHPDAEADAARVEAIRARIGK